MNLKTAFFILGVVLLSTLTSCLGNSDTTEYIPSSDAEITSFSIKGNMLLPNNDTIKNGLEKIVFSIDQVNGVIYNRDSAQYGLRLQDSIIVKYTTASGIYIYNIIGEDSIVIQSEKDSVNLSKPLKIHSFAVNGDMKEYTIKLNIHQVDPNAIVWNQVNDNTVNIQKFKETKTVMFDDILYIFAKYQGETETVSHRNMVLYASSDGLSYIDSRAINLPIEASLSQIQPMGNELFTCTSTGELYSASSEDFSDWTKIETEYPVKNVFGVVGKINKLALAVEKDGTIVSATFDGSKWLYGSELPESFPVQDFSSIPYTRANAGHLSIAGGTAGAAWDTTDGLSWASINSLPSNLLGTNIFLYDGKFYLLNGGAGEDKYNESVYTSIDGMLTWQLAPSKAYLPSNYTFRTGASVVVDSNNTIYIIGGKNNGNPVADIWKGRLNKLN